MILDEKILISGVTGAVGKELATFLAANNEVWGISRFANRTRSDWGAVWDSREDASRAELESAGIITRSVDLAVGDFSSLPSDFTYVLHLAWMRSDLAHLEDALRTNVEGPGLLLAHCRKAKAALVMSGMGIYTGNPDPWHPYTETDPIGRGATAYAPTSPACKLGVESVARYCARAFELPVVITRLNTFMGTAVSFPGLHIRAVLDGTTMTAPHDPNPHSPIHVDDMKDHLEALLDAASTPAFVTNWCGDEIVTAQQWVEQASALSRRDATITVNEPPPGSPTGTVADPTRRLSVTGPCRTVFNESFERLYRDIVAATSLTDGTAGRQSAGG